MSQSSASTGSIGMSNIAHDHQSRSRSKNVLLVLLALALVRGLLYALLSPPGDGPDEPAHFQYVAYLATGGKAGPIGLEGHQPVVYYALVVPAYWLTAGQPETVQLFAVRAASVLFLLGTVAFTWLAARKLTPGSTFVPALAAGFIALHPALAYISGTANNDNAANLMGAILVYLIVLLLAEHRKWWVTPVMAIALGTAVATKGQILPIVAATVVGLVYGVVSGNPGRNWKKVAIYLSLAVVLAAVFLVGTAGVRILETSATSGSILMNWHVFWDMVQRSNPQEVLSVAFTTFWTAYLAGSIRPATAWYYALAAVVLLPVAGYSFKLIAKRRWPGTSAALLRMILLVMLLGVAAVAYLRFLYMFQDPDYRDVWMVIQGHFLHVAIAPLALLVAEGWSLLTTPRLRVLAGVGILAVLSAFDVVSLAVLVGHYTWR